jgi:cysteinyl-tRNA synthetase
MKLYNTLTRDIEELELSHNKAVTIYSCGPTVYDHAHIGNLCSFIYADVLKRTLKQNGYNVRHVMNFTDVDDKTIRNSQELYPNLEPKAALEKLTRHYEDIFKQDMVAVGNSVEDITFIRATDAITEMQQLIIRLFRDGFAYLADDGVYFSIESYRQSGKKYGQLVHIDNSNTAQARIANDEYDKESAHDFALWKLQKDNEPAWDLSLNSKNLRGRPGWHIECSAMSTMKLGQPFDIHTGGIDLMFPHHENEIAQSTAGKDNPVYAKVFFHSEHLLVEGKKMSKSLNNFYTLKDIRAKGYDPLAFRLLVLQSHYRKQSNFTWDNLDSAQNVLHKIQSWSDLRFQDLQSTSLHANYIEATNVFHKHVNEDLGMPDALSILHGTINRIDDLGIDSQSIAKLSDIYSNTLGITLNNRNDLNDNQKKLLHERQTCRNNQDWTNADRIRTQLKHEGVEVSDTQYGQIWSRI